MQKYNFDKGNPHIAGTRLYLEAKLTIQSYDQYNKLINHNETPISIFLGGCSYQCVLFVSLLSISIIGKSFSSINDSAGAVEFINCISAVG